MKQTAHARHERWSRRFPEALAHHPVDRVLMSRCASNENRTRADSKLIGGAGARRAWGPRALRASTLPGTFHQNTCYAEISSGLKS
jgi:hypothetical protein